jgi:phosphoribosylformylglycinamidine synthase I
MDIWASGGFVMIKIAVILFPGTNCENETALAVKTSGMEADIIRWNDLNKLDFYDGYVLPGGWSYEDRIRAGIISAQDPIMKIIKREAKTGKPVLGICNGCQILVESGLIPGLKDKVEMALAPNIKPPMSGFYCTWVKIKNVGIKNAFNLLLEQNGIIDIPIAHAEGRFTTVDKGLINKLKSNKQIAFQYCNERGDVIDKFPVNPNGSVHNIAGISNKKGNVLAMMPHPERATFGYQAKEGNHSELLIASKIFASMRRYIEQRLSSK